MIGIKTKMPLFIAKSEYLYDVLLILRKKKISLPTINKYMHNEGQTLARWEKYLTPDQIKEYLIVKNELN